MDTFEKWLCGAGLVFVAFGVWCLCSISACEAVCSQAGYERSDAYLDGSCGCENWDLVIHR